MVVFNFSYVFFKQCLHKFLKAGAIFKFFWKFDENLKRYSSRQKIWKSGKYGDLTASTAEKRGHMKGRGRSGSSKSVKTRSVFLFQPSGMQSTRGIKKKFNLWVTLFPPIFRKFPQPLQSFLDNVLMETHLAKRGQNFIFRRKTQNFQILLYVSISGGFFGHFTAKTQHVAVF